MASKNVETLRAAHESWNRRDFEATVSAMTEDVSYTDRARNLRFKSRSEFKNWVIAWAKAFSDGKIISPRYLDAGDTVIAEFKFVPPRNLFVALSHPGRANLYHQDQNSTRRNLVAGLRASSKGERLPQ